jgi:hypothetical protein
VATANTGCTNQPRSHKPLRADKFVRGQLRAHFGYAASRLIAQERRPALARRRAAEPTHVSLNGALGDVDSELEQLAPKRLAPHLRFSMAMRLMSAMIFAASLGFGELFGLLW